MKRYALITGASSGIGNALCRLLLTEQTDADSWEIYGMSRHASVQDVSGLSPECAAHYHPIVCDLRKHAALTSAVKTLQQTVSFHLLVNNAGVGFFGPHEEISPSKLHSMVAVNLEAPLILTGLLLRDLKKKKGTVLNISSVTARGSSNTHGCAYGATKAGLTSFGNSLFEEVRKYGVRVITLQPDMTESHFYDEANFKPDQTTAEIPDKTPSPPLSPSCLTAEEVARTALSLLSLRDGSLITELTLRPQLHRITRKQPQSQQNPKRDNRKEPQINADL